MKKNKRIKQSQPNTDRIAAITNILFPDEHIIPAHLSLIQITCGIAAFLAIFFIYLKTLYPTIGLLDSGDMVSSAYNLGISHPPGYPLYCLLGKLWLSIIPFGNIAFRMNIFSSLAASFACMMVYFIVLKVIPVKAKDIMTCLPAIVAAGMLAFAATFWKQAVIAEKYTLNAAFAATLIFILLKWQENAACKQKKMPSQGYLFYLPYAWGFPLPITFKAYFLYLQAYTLSWLLIGE